MSLFAFLHDRRLPHPAASAAGTLALWAVLVILLFFAVLSGAIFVYGFHSGIIIG